MIYETLSGNESREWVDSDKIPQDLKNAVVAIEDERFSPHAPGFRTMLCP